MAFDIQKLATIGGVPIDAPTIYSYKTTDTLAVVTTASYFTTKRLEFEAGDIINALTADGHAMLEITSDTSTAKVIDIWISQISQAQEITEDYSQVANDDIIFCTGTLEVTLIDAADAHKPVIIRNISGTTTITPSVGTSEKTSLSVGQSTTLAPRASGWFEV